MEITVTRHTFTDKSTIGDILVNGTFICHSLEDRDRKLENDLSKKLKGKTAIPTGCYQVVRNMSTRFGKILPLLLDVPAFEGVRIHSGNCDADTEGCILTGKTKSEDWIGDSRAAFDELDTLIKKALDNGEEVWLTIERVRDSVLSQ